MIRQPCAAVVNDNMRTNYKATEEQREQSRQLGRSLAGVSKTAEHKAAISKAGRLFTDEEEAQICQEVQVGVSRAEVGAKWGVHWTPNQQTTRA
jgi:hypothetical protein